MKDTSPSVDNAVGSNRDPQTNRASAPIAPQTVQTMRGPKDRTTRSSARQSDNLTDAVGWWPSHTQSRV